MIAKFVDRARRGEPREQGFFMVWFALTFVALTAFAGLAIEYNRWQQIATRAQKAADAAALGGAVFMPENAGNRAYTTAQTISRENGFKNGSNGITVTPSVGRLPNQLKVTVSIKTKNPFGAIVNYNNTTIVRSAVAEYQLPQNLGSPQNSYGNDPESGGAQPQLWGNVFGPSSNKDKGDAIQSVGPTANTTLCNADNCNGPPAPASPVAGQNRDYDPAGYFYGIDVPAGTTSALNVQVYDPAFVHVGDNCGSSDGNAANSLNKAATLLATDIPGYSGTITPAVRYASAGSSAFCNGDNYYADGGNTVNPWTTWTLRAPDISTWDPTNNPIVCQAEFPGVFPETTNGQPTGTIDQNAMSTLLKQSSAYPGTNPPMSFASFFRQWVSICSVTNPVQGTYFLQVQTGKKIDGTAAPNGGGSNRFAIRAGVGANFSATNGVHVYGNQKMGVYANATGANTQFFLTRVLPGEAGKTLVLNFYDTGDASQPGKLAVLPPADSNVSGGVFANCVFAQPPGNASGPPWGAFTSTGAGCSIANVGNATTPNYNGQWVTWEIPIPSTYTCSASNALGCWTKLQFIYPPGTNVSDTTTWSAYILGEPVRLIQ